jgi:uncharacterized protein YegJ (DUF2314 family)
MACCVVIVFAGLLETRSSSRPDDDAEMTAAIAKAREALPQFWQTFEKQDQGESGFALKLKVTDARGTEHFWVTNLERNDGKMMGTVNNDPQTVASVKLGQRVEIREADISDWLYLRDGKIVGNHTLKPLLCSHAAGGLRINRQGF